MNTNRIEIRKTKPGDIPITKNTAYKWHSEKRYPNVVYKVGGILFFDLLEWDEMAEKAKVANVKSAAKLRTLTI